MVWFFFAGGKGSKISKFTTFAPSKNQAKK
jgi:hypothetical protein